MERGNSGRLASLSSGIYAGGLLNLRFLGVCLGVEAFSHRPLSCLKVSHKLHVEISGPAPASTESRRTGVHYP